MTCVCAGLHQPVLDAAEIEQSNAGFCKEHKLAKREGSIRIYDAFMLNSELDTLEIRMLELADVVDYFVIGEFFSSLLSCGI